MLLPSRIELWALGDILGRLLRAGVSGTLSLLESEGPRAGTAHHVELVEGAPAAVLSDGPRLGELLAATGAVRPRDVERAVGIQRGGDDRMLGELLLDVTSAPPAVLESLRAQTRARIEQLFSLGRAQVTFRATTLGDRELTALRRAGRGARPLEPREYLHGRPRARAGDTSARAARAADLSLLGLGPSARQEEIRQAFRRLVHVHHPDFAREESERAERTATVARLAGAYHRLTASR